MSMPVFELVFVVNVPGTPATVPEAVNDCPTPLNCKCKYSTRAIQLRVNAHSIPAPAAHPLVAVVEAEAPPPVNGRLVVGQPGPAQVPADVVELWDQAQPPVP